jgi:hypothetical protein
MPLLHRIERERFPNLEFPRELEAPRHDANDCVNPVVQRDRFADEMRVATRLPLPERFAYDHDLIAPDLFLFRRKRPA